MANERDDRDPRGSQFLVTRVLLAIIVALVCGFLYLLNR